MGNPGLGANTKDPLMSGPPAAGQSASKSGQREKKKTKEMQKEREREREPFQRRRRPSTTSARHNCHEGVPRATFPLSEPGTISNYKRTDAPTQENSQTVTELLRGLLTSGKRAGSKIRSRGNSDDWSATALSRSPANKYRSIDVQEMPGRWNRTLPRRETRFPL